MTKLPQITNKKEITGLKFSLKKVTFQDQFGNEVLGVACQCGKVGLEKDYQAFTNYGINVRKIYLCNKCFEEIEKVSDRVKRKREDLERRNIPNIFGMPKR